MDFSEEDLRLIARGVQKYISEGGSENVVSNLMNFTEEQIKYIVNHKINGKSSLIVACQLGNIHVVKYFVDNGYADLERTGLTRIEGDFVDTTPVWIAAKTGQYEILEYLIEKGANINCCGDQASLLHVACQDGNVKLVKLLLKNCADVNLPDKDNKKCIQKALNKPDILRCLVFSGADTNVFFGKRPLLHTAVQQNLLESVEILLDGGVDTSAVDFDKTTALQLAAIGYKAEIVQLFLSKLSVPRSTVVETYELLGAAALENNLLDRACELWWTSLQMEMEEPIAFPYNTDIIRSIIGGYPEPKSLEELQELTKSNLTRLKVRALIVREKFLGPYHTDNVFKFIVFGMEKATESQFEKSFQILQCAYSRMVERHGLLIKVELYIVTQIASVCCCIMQEYMSKKHGFIPVGHLFSLVMDVVDQLEYGSKLMKKEPEQFGGKDKKVYQDMMHVVVDILYLTYKMDQLTDNSTFINCLHRMICINPTGTNGNSVLHLALSRHPNPKLQLEKQKLEKWHYILADILLQNGMNPNARNKDGETPLHIYLRHANNICRPATDIVNLLRHHGAHIDICDEYGVSLFTSAKLVGIKIDLVRDCSLMCLATHAILRNQIPYDDDLPGFLIDFVKMHICRETKETL